MTDRLVKVTRKEYGKYIRGNELTDKPIEAMRMSVMQHVDGKGYLMAQAVYPKGGQPYYQIMKVQP